MFSPFPAARPVQQSAEPEGAPIYMDYNGSAPVTREVADAMMPYLTEHQGNPTARHWASRYAASAIEDARKNVARLIGAEADEIVLTSGATEANNMALKGDNMALTGVWEARSRSSGHVIIGATEHDSVLETARSLKLRGASLTLAPVDRFGRVTPEALEKLITPETVLVSIMHANNETGTISPIAELARVARQKGVLFHTDAAQSTGKIGVDVTSLGVDLLSLTGHKFGAPKGIGALYVRAGRRLSPLLHGGGQSGGMRSGTESALLAAGLAAAANLATSRDMSEVRALRDYFWKRLQQEFAERVVLQGHPEHRVPNTLSVAFPGHFGADILAQMPNVAATTGSACHASCTTMSHTLTAMGIPLSQGEGTIRFSLGPGNTKDEVDRIVRVLSRLLGGKVDSKESLSKRMLAY